MASEFESVERPVKGMYTDHIIKPYLIIHSRKGKTVTCKQVSEALQIPVETVKFCIKRMVKKGEIIQRGGGRRWGYSYKLPKSERPEKSNTVMLTPQSKKSPIESVERPVNGMYTDHIIKPYLIINSRNGQKITCSQVSEALNIPFGTVKHSINRMVKRGEIIRRGGGRLWGYNYQLPESEKNIRPEILALLPPVKG